MAKEITDLICTLTLDYKDDVRYHEEPYFYLKNLFKIRYDLILQISFRKFQPTMQFIYHKLQNFVDKILTNMHQTNGKLFRKSDRWQPSSLLELH